MSTFMLESGFEFSYNPSKCLRPDKVSERIGWESGWAVNHLRMVAKDLEKPVRILDLGVGTGIILLGALGSVENKTNLVLSGIDEDQYCVQLTRKNLVRLSKLVNAKPRLEIVQKDWSDPQTREQLQANKAHVITFNPPYLLEGEQVRPGYDRVPKNTMYVPNTDGLFHYRRMLPFLLDFLSTDPLSSIFIRIPRISNDNPNTKKELEKLIQQMIQKYPARNVIYQFREEIPVEDNRLGSWIRVIQGLHS